MRIQKYLSQRGILSRREAEENICRGLIKLNGKIVTKMGVRVDPEKDQIEVIASKARQSFRDKKITALVYKARGVVCSRNRKEGKTIFEQFPQFDNLNVVGRLDKYSEGLLLLSNDGVVTAVVTGKNHFIEKKYEVTIREEVLPGLLKIMEQGIMLDGKKTLPARTKKLSSHSFSIVISEGRNHQIRRMADFVRFTIERLVRTRIGTLTSAGLGLGKSRMLGEKEIVEIKKHTKVDGGYQSYTVGRHLYRRTFERGSRWASL